MCVVLPNQSPHELDEGNSFPNLLYQLIHVLLEAIAPLRFQKWI